MKKIIVSLIVVILLAGVGTPFVSGLIMERIIRQSIDDIARMYAASGSGVSVEITQYDRQYASSRIEWKISSKALKALYGEEQIVFVDHADHGVTRFVTQTSLEKNNWFMEFINQKLNGKNPLKIQTEYMLSGKMKSTLSLSAFSYTEGNRVIDVMPGQIMISGDKRLNHIASELSWAGCSIPGKVKVDMLSLNSKMEKISAYIWDGTVSFKIKALNAITSENNETLVLSNLFSDYALVYQREAQVLSVGMSYGVGRATAGKDEIKDVFVRMGIKKMDSKGYEDLMKFYVQTMTTVMEEVAESHKNVDAMKKMAEKQMAGMGLQLVGICEKLLKKGLEIQVSDLRAQLPQGEIKGDITLGLKKNMTLVQFIPIMMQPSVALSVFDLKSDIILPSKLVGDDQVLLSPLYPGMETGLFVKKEAALVHTAQTREGKLFLNNKEVVLD